MATAASAISCSAATGLPPPAGSAVYQLTEVGKALEPVMVALGRWGARFMGAPRKTDVLVPRAYFVAMRGTFRPEAAAGINETYELRIGDLLFEVRIEQGRLTTSEGRATNPDAVMTLDVATLNALLFGLLTPAAALASGRVQIKGDANALERLLGVSGFGRPGMVDQPSAQAVRKASVGARRATRSAG